MLRSIDQWMAAHPWRPRVAPFFVYLLLLAVTGFARDSHPRTYPLLYAIQCVAPALMLWRYRRLTPELNWRFHWLAVPVAIAMIVAWVAIGRGLVQRFPDLFASDPVPFTDPGQMGKVVGGVALGLRLAGMSIVVPMVEELFVRSLLLRSLADPRKVGAGLLQALEDMPVIGEWLMDTRLGEWAAKQGPIFGPEFERHTLADVTVFGVAASTGVFTLSHGMRDYPACIVFGVACCLLVYGTNRGANKRGLGPVIWMHGLTNALLWAYTVGTWDWQFL